MTFGPMAVAKMYDISIFRFDLLVNGGGAVTLQFQRAKFQPKTVTVPVVWNDIVVLDPIVLTLKDLTEEEKPTSEFRNLCIHLLFYGTVSSGKTRLADFSLKSGIFAGVRKCINFFVRLDCCRLHRFLTNEFFHVDSF